jgi:hypothetical protein
MTVALRERTAQRLFDTGEEATLDEVVTTVWANLATRGSARCLVCGATVTRLAGDDDAGSRAHCAACGTSLE